MKLENWSLKIAYTNRVARLADFLSKPCQLTGNVYGNAEVLDGRYFITDVVVKIENGIATTQSGKVYELGYPLANFKDYVEIKEAADAFRLPKKNCDRRL